MNFTPPFYNSTRADRSCGAALAVVLWITFGLVSIALYFGNAMSMQLKSAANIHAGAQAEQAIEGAARFIKYYLTTLENEGVVPYDENYRWDRSTVGEASFWAVGRDNNNANLTEPHFDLIDESGKINLNMANDTQLVDMLEKFTFMTPEFAAAIADWRDEDQDVRENGAESESYSRTDPAYIPKDGPFESIEELRLVVGATEENLLGEDYNRNGILDPNEDDGDLSPPNDNGDGNLDFGLLDFVTVYSKTSILQTNAEPKFNINGLTGTTTTEMAEAIEELVSGGRGTEIAAAISGAPNLLTLFQNLENSANVTIQEFGMFDDLLLTSTNAQVGLININVASREVIATLPNLDEGDADSIVGYRLSNQDNLTSVAWVTEALNDPAKVPAIAPFITDKGHQFTADISALGKNMRGYRRSVIVFDISEELPKIVYRREMTREGWALGSEIRREIVSQKLNQP
jgi:type II secretory pathway component PulK